MRKKNVKTKPATLLFSRVDVNWPK